MARSSIATDPSNNNEYCNTGHRLLPKQLKAGMESLEAVPTQEKMRRAKGVARQSDRPRKEEKNEDQLEEQDEEDEDVGQLHSGMEEFIVRVIMIVKKKKKKKKRTRMRLMILMLMDIRAYVDSACSRRWLQVLRAWVLQVLQVSYCSLGE